MADETGRLDRGPTDSVDALGVLLRWEEFGGTWRVLSSDSTLLTVSLCRCDGGEEVEQLRSRDPALAAFVGGRQASGD
jgi:hypothetical protein